MLSSDCHENSIVCPAVVFYQINIISPKTLRCLFLYLLHQRGLLEHCDVCLIFNMFPQLSLLTDGKFTQQVSWNFQYWKVLTLCTGFLLCESAVCNAKLQAMVKLYLKVRLFHALKMLNRENKNKKGYKRNRKQEHSENL